MKNIEILSNAAWVFYVDEQETDSFDEEKVGKWMYFFNDRTFAEKICRQTVEDGLVAEAKHSNDEEGVCCFYLNCDDMAAHKRIITYFIENRLIRRTKTGKLYNISFKLDSQTAGREYGDKFNAEIKLSKFVNLETGEWIGE